MADEPDPLAELPTVAEYLRANKDKPGILNDETFRANVQKFNQLRDLQETRAKVSVPISRPDPTLDPRARGAPPPDYVVDVSQPIEKLRVQMQGLPEDQRQRVLDAWARHQEKQQNEAAPWYTPGGVARGFDTATRAIARGVPGGTWGDELNAATRSVLPSWAGGKPYDEALAAERARDARSMEQNPVSTITGNVVGGLASAPLTNARGAGLPRQVATDTAIGAVQGAGEAQGSWWDRMRQAGKDAMTSGGASLLLRKMFGQPYDRYSRETPGIRETGERLGVETPFFARAEDPTVQAAGRRAAQMDASSPPGQGWQGAMTGTEESIGNTVQTVTGAPTSTAPHRAGTSVQGGMGRTVEDIGARMTQVADETSNQMPPGVRYQPTETRAAVGDVVAQREAAGNLDPYRGLNDVANMATNPEGVTWPGLSTSVTQTGERIRNVARGAETDVSDRELQRVYAAQRGGDQPRIVRQELGPAGEARFVENVEIQNQMAGVRDRIRDALQSQQPEQLISLAHNAATVKGGGTALNTLDTIARSLNPEEMRQLGAGVLAKITNEASQEVPAAAGVASRFNPNGVARRLNEIPEEARNILWPPNTPLGNTVNDLRTLTTRLGAVDQMQGRGSVASLGERMASGTAWLGPVGGLGYLAHQAELGGPAAILAAAYGAGQIPARMARPYLYQHGLPPGLREPIDILESAAARTAGQQKYGPSPLDVKDETRRR